MRRFTLFAALLFCFSLSSCQCSDKPPVGPVEDEEQSAVVVVPSNRV